MSGLFWNGAIYFGLHRVEIIKTKIERTTMLWPYDDLEFRNLGSINRSINMENYISIKLYIQNKIKIIK